MSLGKKILEVLKWVIMVGVFASLGFGTDNKKLMVPLYAIFFALAFVGVYVFMKLFSKGDRQKSHLFAKAKPIIGAVLVVASLFVPSYFLKEANFSAGIHALLVLITLVLVVISAFAVKMINGIKSKLGQKIIGYVILFVMAAVPGFAMTIYDNSYSSLGLAYYIAIIVSVLSWSGLTSILKKA